MPSRAATLAILAIASAGIVATEVLLTRLLSLAVYYGLAFAILSLAMLGLSAGSLQAVRARERGDALRPWVARRLVLFAALVMLATLAVARVRLAHETAVSSFVGVLVVAAAAALPMIAGGSIVARILGESSVAVSALYGADLVAAGAGALAPLVLLGPLSGPCALFAVAFALALAGALAAREARWIGAGVAAAAAATVVMAPGSLDLRYPKGYPRAPTPALYERWNALSHVELRPFTWRAARDALWAPSPRTPELRVRTAYAHIDGDAGTVVHAYDASTPLDVLGYDVTSVAHRLRPTGTACVIGVGGGRDVLAALAAGHDRVLGAEINPAIVAMVRSVSDVSPVLSDPRVEVVVGDGRSVFSDSRVSCRVLQAALVDTWAATSAGAFAHSEATIYTREAWRVLLRRVEPDGVLTFSRWYDPSNSGEAARLVSLAVAALLERGVTRPRDHIALVASGNLATILVDPAPFTAADLEAVHALTRDLGFKALLVADRPSTEAPTLLERLENVPRIEDLAAIGAPLGLDTSPPTDDRPFFFQLRSASAWWHLDAALEEQTRGGAIAGNASAMFQLLETVAAVLLVGLWLLGPTLVRGALAPAKAMPGRAVVYFACLGAGFMMVEIALVQRMHVVLGHPSYALIVVLAGLLGATGLGSAISPRVLRSRRSVGVASLVAAGVLALLPYVVIGPLGRATLESPLAVRVVWATLCSALVGVTLGLLFPSAMRYVARERGAPIALAVNGFTAVLGSAAAILLSVAAGIPATFAAAALLYALAGLMGPSGWAEAE